MDVDSDTDTETEYACITDTYEDTPVLDDMLAVAPVASPAGTFTLGAITEYLHGMAQDVEDKAEYAAQMQQERAALKRRIADMEREQERLRVVMDALKADRAKTVKATKAMEARLQQQTPQRQVVKEMHHNSMVDVLKKHQAQYTADAQGMMHRALRHFASRFCTEQQTVDLDKNVKACAAYMAGRSIEILYAS